MVVSDDGKAGNNTANRLRRALLSLGSINRTVRLFLILSIAISLTLSVIILVGFTPRPSQTIPTSSPTMITSPSTDRFGITKINPTVIGGLEWSSKWDNGDPRRLVNNVDSNDNWFDTAHGNGTYTIDGKGTLTASGDSVRMYVHDPANSRQWSENLEITLYFKRISESQNVDYSGLQVFARTNHGTNGDEDINLCDDRGYGGLVNVNGDWALEKESAHQLDNGYTDVAVRRPPSPLLSSSSLSSSPLSSPSSSPLSQSSASASTSSTNQLPTDTWIGFKYILRNMDNNTKVKLELYRDMTNGANGGGSWQKVTEFVDDGTNFGVDHGSCKPGINSGLPLVHSLIDGSSETGKPMLSVYARHEYGTMQYSRFSIREIEPLP